MIADSYYHVYNRANGFENLFREPENYRFFIQQWVKYVSPIANTLTYCLLPNHFHFLIKTLDEESLSENFKEDRTLEKYKTFPEFISFRLSKQFSNLFSSYTQAFNKKYKRKGSLFIPSFKSKEITSDDYMTRIILYIHHNPIHHGFTANLDAWPYCSYHDFFSSKAGLVKKDDVIEWFGNMKEFNRIHQLGSLEYEKIETSLT
ncbi:MAG: transposase [Bacteroidota bacterium]